MIQLLNIKKEKIALLRDYKDLYIESNLESGDKTLSFSYAKKSLFYDDIIEENYIRTKTDEFVIKAKDLNGEFCSYICKLNVESLEGEPFDRFESIEQTITNALNLAIVGTGWTVADNTIKKKRTVRMTNCSSWDIVQEIKKIYRIDIEFDTLNKQIKVYERLGSDKGSYFIDSLNLKALQVQSDSHNYATRIIPIGKDGLEITSINHGKNYVENYQYSNKIKTIYWKDDRYTIAENLKEDAEAKLNEISKPFRSYSAEILNLAKLNDKYKNILDYKLGDTITLISKDNRIKDKQRIVRIIEFPDNHELDSVELANATLKFEDIQKEFQDTSDIVNNITVDNGTVDGSTIDGITTKQIEDFEANVIKVTNLKAVYAEIDNLKVGKADIQDLNVVTARIGTLESTKANITELNSVKATLEHAIIGKAEITDLNAAVGKIGILEGNVANINTLVNGNLSSENIQAGGITSDKLTIANGFITNAMISNLDVSKINAGDISTNKFKIKSDDGGIEIVGATQQFKDKNNKVRIQMGKDTQGNFNFILRGEDGTTTLIDHNGIKEKAISDNLIKENMISQNAVGEKAIDYNSFSAGFNKDTNTNTLKATKIKLNNQNQSLEVAFNSLKSQADGTKSLTESHSTTIGVMQGQISTAINNTQIVKNGQTILLKDDYNRTVQTVDSMKSTISSHTTKIDEHTGKITGVESKTNEIERNLNTVSSKLTNVEKNVEELSIDNNNLIPNTDFSKDKTKYYKPWGAGTTIQYSKDPSANGQIVPSHILVVNKLNPTVAGGNVCIETPKVIGGIKADLEYTLSFKAMSRGNTGALDYLYVMSNEEGLANYRIVNEKNKLVINSFGNIEKVSTITFKLNKTYKNASILIGKVKQALANENLYHGFGIWDIILTQGNKIVAWHQAAEDIRAEIDITTSNVSEIKQNLNSITQRVSNTESTTTNINSKLTTLEVWKREAEQKITDSSIINTVSSQFYKKSESDTIFANKTQLTQLDNKFEFKITTAGANNLIANSSFEGGFAEWQLFNKPILSTNTEFLADRYGRMISIESGGGEGIFQRFKTIPGESYTVSFYAEADRQKPLATSIGIEGIHLITLIYEPGFKRWSFTFKATDKIHTFIAYLGQAGKFYLGRVMVTQGTVLQEYREGLGIYSNVVSIDKSGLTVDSSNTNTRTITDSQGFRVQDKRTGENLLEANTKGVSARGGRFYVDGPNGNYTLMWGRDININGGRAIVGTNATPEAPLKPKKMYVNYNNDFTNGVEIAGKLTNNTYEVASLKENQLGGQYIYRAMGDGLIYQCGYKEIKIRDGWIIEDVVNFPKPFPNYCTVFKAELELVDGNNYWTANYTLNSYRLDRLGGKVYGLNQKTYIAAQGAVARVFWWAIGA